MSLSYPCNIIKNGVTEWIRTTEFLDDEIVLSDHTSTTRIKYDGIKRIKENGNFVMIFFRHNVALRIYKDAFVEGSWQECKAKILEKTKILKKQ